MDDISDKEKLRNEYAWLSGYGLSDQALEDLNTLIVRATIGSDTLDVFFTKLKTLLPSDYDESELKSVVSLIVTNSFIPARDTIDGLESWASGLGIKIPENSSEGEDEEVNDDEELNQSGRQNGSATSLNVAPTAVKSESVFETPSNLLKPPSISMAFSTSDEKEIQSIRIPDSGEKIDWAIQAKEIITRFRFQDPDPIIVKRLENIIIAKLKDVRDDLETSDALTRSRKVGGMEFSNSQADSLLSLIKNYNFSIPARDIQSPAATIKVKQPVASPKIEIEDGLPVVRLPDDMMVKPELMDMEELEEELIIQQLKENILNVRIKEKQERQDTESSANQIKDIKKEDFVLNENQEIKEKLVDVPVQAVTPKPEPFLTSKRLPSIPNVKNPSKPNLDGIRILKPVMGPIDELETMTLIEFRRLSSDPTQSARKIKDDIDTLSKEGFDRRSEAIAAWHRSEVSRFYRLLGQTAMSEGKSVEVVISERLTSGKPTLSMNEFEAVMELNKSLRF